MSGWDKDNGSKGNRMPGQKMEPLPDMPLVSQRLVGYVRNRGQIDARDRRAAVAVILRQQQGRNHSCGVQILLIQRQKHENDPWSGHMAFPGGHMDVSDPDLVAAAVREAREEVGLDLAQEGKFLCLLDDLRASAGGRILPLVITPAVFSVEGTNELTPQPGEVAAIQWVSLFDLLDKDNDGSICYTIEETERQLPCWWVDGSCIWGLTYLMMQNLLRVILQKPVCLSEAGEPLPDWP